MKEPEQFGKFLLFGQVAVGGMAEIYKARYADPAMPQMDIALKRILPSYTEDEGFVTMFKDEGNIAIRLKHPNIVNIYEVGEVNNDWYIAMEFVYGSDLRVLSDACEKYQKRFTPTQIARILCETAKALDYAHACTDANGMPLNIVHRDCTPHNIMVTYENGVKLMDFGIAKAASRATKTRVGTVKGKSSYMSPEQARGKQLDGRSDMFTLGTVGWELLTGYRLFKASSDFKILTKVLKAPIYHPSEMDSNVPQALGDIIMKTLERERDMRYPTCGALAEALENWLSVNGDGSDARLGEYCMALTNKKGHSFSELPDYKPGVSGYRYDDENDEFLPINTGNGPRHTMQFTAEESAAVGAIAKQPLQQEVAPMAPAITSGFPAPVMASPAPSSKVPLSYVVGFIFLAIISASFMYMAYGKHSERGERTPDEVVYTPPEAFVVIKSRPNNAIVTVNGQRVEDESGKAQLTPIYSNKRRVGDKLAIHFEKEGYAPVDVERDVVFTQQDIEVTLKTLEESKAESMTAFEAFKITTEPPDAVIFVNGVEKGRSPVTLKEVKFGTELEIEVKPEGAYEPVKRTLVASRGGDDHVNFKLDAVRVAKQDSEKASAAKAKPKPAKKPVVAGKGKIVVKAKPWGSVLIDGVRIGNTTITHEVKSGSHKIDIILPNKNLKVSKTVSIKANGTTEIGYDFNAGKWM